MAELYHLGVDVGTSRVAAATARLAQDGSILATQVPLGRRGDHVPAVMFVTPEGELLFGDTAERRGLTEPERLLREFRRRVGDEVPMLVAGHRLTAASLFAKTVAAVVDTVAEREGAAPASVVVTHPASWGPHRTGLIRAAMADLGLQHIDLLTEPEAAARNVVATRPLNIGDTLAVYDLGGGTFEATVLRRVAADAFSVQGQIHLDDLGGADFDDAVLRHVLTTSALAGVSLDARGARIALLQLRRECIEAKESLSFDSDVAIPVVVPPCNTTVRLTRSEFEGMIEHGLARTLDAMDDALERAGIGAEQVTAFLLVGGSSRIPRVAQRLSELFDRPLAIDPDPKASIALGAARAALVHHGVPPTGALALLDEPSQGLDLIDDTPRSDLVLAGSTASPSPSTTKWYAGLSLGALTVAAALWFGGSAVGGLPGIVNDAQPARMVASPIDDLSAGAQPEEPAATAAAPDPDQDSPAEPAEPVEPAREVVEATTTSAASGRRPSAYLGVPASVLSPTPVPKPKPSPTPTPTPRPTTSQLAPIPDADPSPTPSSSSPTTPPTTSSDPTISPTTPPGTDPPLTPATTPPDPEPTTPAPTTPAPTTPPAPEPTTPAPQPSASPEPTTQPEPQPTTPAPEPSTSPEPTLPPAEPEPDPTPPPPDPTPAPTSV